MDWQRLEASAITYVMVVFLWTISIVFFGLGLWVLQVPPMKKLVSIFASQPLGAGSPTSAKQHPNFENLFSELQDSPMIRFSDIGTTWITSNGGVYIIHDNRGVLYVGRTSNIYHRVRYDHMLGEGASPLRRNLMRELHFNEGQVTSFLTSLCSFQYLELADTAEQTDFEHHVKLKLKPHINF